MREIIFWGAGGQAKVLRDCLSESDHLVALFDANSQLSSPFEDVPLIGGREDFETWLNNRGSAPELLFSVTIGGNHGRARLELQKYLSSYGLKALTVIHRTAFVANDVALGEGSQILAQSAVCVGVRVGRACIVNTAATVDHECIIADGVHIAPGAHLAGCVEVRENAMIGTGAIILPRLTIGEGAVVGAGAVVIKDVAPHTIVVGNPARVLKSVL